MQVIYPVYYNPRCVWILVTGYSLPHLHDKDAHQTKS